MLNITRKCRNDAGVFNDNIPLGFIVLPMYTLGKLAFYSSLIIFLTAGVLGVVIFMDSTDKIIATVLLLAFALSGVLFVGGLISYIIGSIGIDIKVSSYCKKMKKRGIIVDLMIPDWYIEEQKRLRDDD